MISEKDTRERVAEREKESKENVSVLARKPQERSAGEEFEKVTENKVRLGDNREPVPFWMRKMYTVQVDDVWPAPVCSKMKIEEWEILMREAGLEKDIKYIVDGFKNGFCLGIPQHKIPGRRWYTSENHKAAVVAQKQIELTLEKERRREGWLVPIHTKR